MGTTRLLPLAFVLLPVASLADTCPWLGEDVAGKVILVKPSEARLIKEPVPPNDKGLASATTCRFKGAGEGLGQLSVTVMDFGTEANAKARYEGELKSQASRARASKIDGNPAFFTMNRGFSGGTFAQKGKHFVFVSHVFSPRVKDAMSKDPDGAVLSTHEVARQVLGRL